MADGFDLNGGLPPLDAPATDQGFSLAPASLPSLFPQTAATPPFVSPQQTPQAPQPHTKLGLALAAMIPVALAKGGPGAAAALIQGIAAKQAEAQKLQQQQQEMAIRQQQANTTESYRKNVIDEQRRRANAAFLQSLPKGIAGIDNPDDLQQYRDTQYATAQALGLDITPDQIKSVTNVAPTELEKRQAQNALAKIEKAYPTETARERLEQGNAVFPVGQERLTLAQIRARAGEGALDQGGQPMAIPPAAATERPQRVEGLLNGRPQFAFQVGTKFQDSDGNDVTKQFRPLQTPAERQAASGAASGQATVAVPEWALDASVPSKADPNANVPDKTIGFTPNGLYQSAITYIKAGRFPPTGIGNQPAARAKRDAIINKSGAIAADAGMDIPTLRAFYKTNEQSLLKQQQFYDSADAFLRTADKNSDMLAPTLQKIPDTGSPVFNKPLRAFQQSVMGNTELSAFATNLASVQNEYAKILNNPNLTGQLTDAARHEAQVLVSPTATVGQIVRSLQVLKAEGGNRLISIGDQIRKITGRMNGIGSVGGGPAPASGNAADPLGIR